MPDALDALRVWEPVAHGGPIRGETGYANGELDFSVCVNAYGPAESVVAAVRAAAIDRYPDPGSRAACVAAARYWGQPVESIAFGAGTTELIHAICRLYLRPGDRVAVPAPTFGEYAHAARLHGAAVDAIPSLGALVFDVEAMVSAVRETRPRLAFVCTPNNPTGELLSRETLAVLAETCEAAGTMLVVDQSYEAFVDNSYGTPVLPAHLATLHLRSITKDHALAGLRAGYVLGPPHVIAAIEGARASWPVSTVAQAAAEAAMSAAGRAHLDATIPRLRRDADLLRHELRASGYAVLPSETHYFLVEVGDAGAVRARLLAERGVRVRDCASFGLPRYVRIAARKPEENARLLAAMARR